jgi:hypothetical protein
MKQFVRRNNGAHCAISDIEARCTSGQWRVGWAKPADANASGGVPTIQAAHPDQDGGHGAKARLCPPYDLCRACFASFNVPPHIVQLPRGDIMGKCEYCGESAGLFRSIHNECSARRDQARKDIDLAFKNVMLVPRPPAPATFRAIIEKLGNDGQLAPDQLRARVLSGLAIALDTALTDLDLSQNELGRFDSILDAFGLDASAAL